MEQGETSYLLTDHRSNSLDLEKTQMSPFGFWASDCTSLSHGFLIFMVGLVLPSTGDGEKGSGWQEPGTAQNAPLMGTVVGMGV